jgi:hypothetical protein
MRGPERNIVEVLKAELAFVEGGGYRTKRFASWRPRFIFEDSPTCLNYHCEGSRLPCSECALMTFVPRDRQAEKFPCRYIPLNQAGETVMSFYQYGTPEELEGALKDWLRTTIRRIESERAIDKPLARESAAKTAAALKE